MGERQINEETPFLDGHIEHRRQRLRDQRRADEAHDDNEKFEPTQGDENRLEDRRNFDQVNRTCTGAHEGCHSSPSGGER